MDEIEILRAENEQLKKKVTSLTKVTEDKDAEIATLITALSDRDGLILSYKQAESGKIAQIDKLTSDISEIKKELEGKDGIIEGLKNGLVLAGKVVEGEAVKLIDVIKGAVTIAIHPKNLEDHIRLGWKVK